MSAVLQGIRQTPDYRYNLFVVETTGNPVSGQITIRTPDGADIVSAPLALRAWEQRLLSVSTLAPGRTIADATLHLQMTGGAGRAVAAGSLAASGSTDATAFEMSFSTSTLVGTIGPLLDLGPFSSVVLNIAGETYVLPVGGQHLAGNATNPARDWTAVNLHYELADCAGNIHVASVHSNFLPDTPPSASPPARSTSPRTSPPPSPSPPTPAASATAPARPT